MITHLGHNNVGRGDAVHEKALNNVKKVPTTPVIPGYAMGEPLTCFGFPLRVYGLQVIRDAFLLPLEKGQRREKRTVQQSRGLKVVTTSRKHCSSVAREISGHRLKTTCASQILRHSDRDQQHRAACFVDLEHADALTLPYSALQRPAPRSSAFHQKSANTSKHYPLELPTGITRNNPEILNFPEVLSVDGSVRQPRMT